MCTDYSYISLAGQPRGTTSEGYGSLVSEWMTPACEDGLVSVIVPTFNRRNFLIECVESVRAQTYRPIELIVVDDGSTDETQAALADWASGVDARDNLSVVNIRQNHSGAQVARNRGLVHSHGQFIQLLDSDDVLLSDKIQKDIELLRSSNADFAYSAVLQVDQELRSWGRKIGSPWNGSDNEVVDYLWQTMGPVYQRNMVVKAGPWLEDLTDAQDWEYSARVKLLGFRGVFRNEVGGLFRDHVVGKMRTKERYTMEVRSFENAYRSVLSTAEHYSRLSAVLRARLARRFISTALLHGRAGMMLERRSCLETALRLAQPASMSWWGALGLSFCPWPSLDRRLARLLMPPSSYDPT